MISKAGELYQVIWKAIIRPPRDVYEVILLKFEHSTLKRDQFFDQPSELGPALFSLGGQYFGRRDFELLNDQKIVLKCSHFEPLSSNKQYLNTPYPCVIYLHGNCSSRLEALNCGCLRSLLPLGISVLCFDFSGSGHSGGDYVTLGWNERRDLKCVVNHLRLLTRISTIGLWGRSMGAGTVVEACARSNCLHNVWNPLLLYSISVTACMYADSDPTIAGMVIDSPFSSLRRLAEELVHDFVGWKVPKLFLAPALSLFDIDTLKPIEHCRKSYIPALFVAAADDTFIRPQHCRDMHGAYMGDKNLIVVAGSHNTRRPSFLLDSISIFFQFALKLNQPASGVRQIWQDVAVSLAMHEQARRRGIMQKEKGQQQPAICATSSMNAKNEISEIKSHPDAGSNNSCGMLSKHSSGETEDDEDASLATAVAQMMLLESIQADRHFFENSDATKFHNSSESQSTAASANEVQSSFDTVIQMPVAPHRVKKSISS